MPYRICLISLGCAKNQVNSEQMLYLLNQAGHEVVGEVDGCDVAIVNTCGFIDGAKAGAIDQILQLAEVSRQTEDPRDRLPVRSGTGHSRALPEVDGMLGSFGQICAAVEDVMHDGRPLYFGDKSGPIEEIGRVVLTGPGWAYLRIAGCDNWCAFCAIPAIRGRYRSRTLDAIVQEAKASPRRERADRHRAGHHPLGHGPLRKAEPRTAAAGTGEDRRHPLDRLHYLYEMHRRRAHRPRAETRTKIVKYLDIPINTSTTTFSAA